MPSWGSGDWPLSGRFGLLQDMREGCFIYFKVIRTMVYICVHLHTCWQAHTGACTCVCTCTCLWSHVHSHTCVSACARVCVPFVKQERKAKWEEPGAEPTLQAGACRAWNEGPGGDGEIGVTCPPRTLETASWLPITHLVNSFLVPTTCPTPC